VFEGAARRSSVRTDIHEQRWPKPPVLFSFRRVKSLLTPSPNLPRRRNNFALDIALFQ
jgi:hypothetical protein